jgi:hypothetical protein
LPVSTLRGVEALLVGGRHQDQVADAMIEAHLQLAESV